MVSISGHYRPSRFRATPTGSSADAQLIAIQATSQRKGMFYSECILSTTTPAFLPFITVTRWRTRKEFSSVGLRKLQGIPPEHHRSSSVGPGVSSLSLTAETSV
ncbi:hypothetical protein CEXT_152791 [Caerostris extrusa]|uniref:Uncharacterized protein n=1 Tax=Caerostris extrusa TaxID=172846 RepID=A0AAV4TRE3_CAEEX|nr:hypothetical protein CEXT_152791 [Caerostris extrusa]